MSPGRVIVTSSAAAGVYLERHVANLRLGMTLELFTAIGALVGGLVAFLLDERSCSGPLRVLLVYVGVTMARGGAGPPRASAPPWRTRTRDERGPGRRTERRPRRRLSGPGYGVTGSAGDRRERRRGYRLGPARDRRRASSRSR